MTTSIFLLAVQLMSATALPVSSLGIENCEFGEIYAFSKVECQFAVSNGGDKPVRIFDIISNRASDVSDQKELIIAPHSHAYVRVQLNTDNAVGNISHGFRFHSDEGATEYRANAHGFAMSVLDQFQPEIDFGVVEPGSESQTEHKLSLTSHDSANFGIAKIEEVPMWLDAKVGADGNSIETIVRQDADWGAHSGFIKLVLKSPKQKHAWIAVKADIHGGVIPAFNPLELGLLRVGDKNQFRIPLNSRTDQQFDIGKVELRGIKGEVKAEPCAPATVRCRWLELTISDQQIPGLLKGDVVVSLARPQRKLSIAVKGFLADKDFVTKKIDQDTLNGTSKYANASDSSATPRSSSDLNKAIRSAVKEGTEVPPPGNGPLLKWHIANGRPIHGFQIFRAVSEAGPFVLLNEPSMPSTAEDEEPVSYQYRDSTAESGKSYWYYIGIVYSDGHKQQLNNPQKVVAK